MAHFTIGVGIRLSTLFPLLFLDRVPMHLVLS
jgi:hypothetical protein